MKKTGKKRTYTWIVIIILAVMLLSITLFFEQKHSFLTNYSIEKIKSSDAFSDIDVAYPNFKQEDPAYERVNRDVKNYVDSSLRQLKNNSPKVKGRRSYLKMTYQIWLVSKGLLSFSLGREMSYSLSAHPFGEQKTFNYDLNKAKQIYLNDIFSSNDYLSFLSDYCYKQLLRVDPALKQDLDWVKKGTAPVKSNFSDFYLTSAAMHIVFQTYQVGPRYTGFHVVKIPYYQLYSYMKDEFLELVYQ